MFDYYFLEHNAGYKYSTVTEQMVPDHAKLLTRLMQNMVGLNSNSQ
jgi:hypothetical protein